MNLRHRVTIQHKTVTRDADGIAAETWQDVTTVWAAVEPLRGREYLQAMAVAVEVTTRVRVRCLPGVTPAMRLLFGSRIFNIVSVIDPEERHRELQLMCVEVVGDG